MSDWKRYLREVQGHLEELRSMGITELVLPPAQALPEAQRAAAPAAAERASLAVPPRPAPPPPPMAKEPSAFAPRLAKPVVASPSATPMADTAGAATAAAPESLEKIQADSAGCTRCRLSEGRKNIVFGIGNPHAELMFVGEGPGEDEDRTGEPFVGAAGQLLTKIIEAMGVSRGDVYIANTVKCRPPQNRTPMIDEIEACYPYLRRQVAAIKPKIVVALGAPASHTLLGVSIPISRLRGTFYRYGDVRVMPTFHPAYLLRNPAEKKSVWEDMQKVMAELGWKKKEGGA